MGRLETGHYSRPPTEAQMRICPTDSRPRMRAVRARVLVQRLGSGHQLYRVICVRSRLDESDGRISDGRPHLHVLGDV